MTNIVALKSPPKDLSARLRELAEMVDDGRIKDMVIAYVCDGNYEFTYGSSLTDCLTMSDLLHQNCIDRMRA